MKKIKMNTKINAILLCLLLIGICAFNATSLTRTITDSSDTIETYIRNSNGNYWEADGTGDNVEIQAALDDVAGTHGTVWATGNRNYSIDNTIILPWNVTYDGANTIYRPTGDFTVFVVNLSSTLRDVTILTYDENGDSVYTNNTYAVRIMPTQNVFGNPKWMQEGFDAPKHTAIDGLNVIGDNATKTGGGLLLLTNNATHDSIGAGQFQNLHFMYLHKGLHLNLSGEGDYINLNWFINVGGTDCQYFIHLNDTSSVGSHEITMNRFLGVYYEAEDDVNEPGELYPIKLSGNCHQNSFTNIAFMDWINDGERDEYIIIDDADSERNMFSGTTLVSAYIIDNGSKNCFIGPEYANFDNLFINNDLELDSVSNYAVLSGTSDALGLKIEADVGTIWISYETGVPVSLFESADSGENKFLSIFGNKIGSGNEALKLRWGTGSANHAEISTSPGGGNIVFVPDGGKVNITNVLNIVPQSGPPANPSAGDIYFESDNNTHCGYDGTAWKALY